MDRLWYETADRSPTQPHEPWFGIEQEYFITDGDGVPLSYDPRITNYSNMCNYQKKVSTGMVSNSTNINKTNNHISP